MEHEWTHCYRIRAYYRNLGLVGTIFFAAVGVVFTLLAYFNIDGSFAHPKLTALICGLFWSAFTCLGGWVLLVYYKYRLLVNDTTLRQISVFRDKQVDLHLVDQSIWCQLV